MPTNAIIINRVNYPQPVSIIALLHQLGSTEEEIGHSLVRVQQQRYVVQLGTVTAGGQAGASQVWLPAQNQRN